MPDSEAVNSMFGRIAHRYDLANHVLSAGIDVYWRFRMVNAVRHSHPHTILDLATGSGLPGGTRVLGMDFCAPMIEIAQQKKERHPGRYPNVEFSQGDALVLPLPDAHVDAVTIAFGLRNMADRPRCLAEIRRVLRPGGHLYVLEFSQPWPWVRPFYAFQLRWVVPRLAGLLTGDRGAYEYLGTSIGGFPGKERLSDEIRAAGLAVVSASAMTLGIVALHVARREPAS
jgi:demethylmenaquinone methyltransferase / 2-methoxy-6-polyprenyl-1,4-benzoquinol methylase